MKDSMKRNEGGDLMDDDDDDVPMLSALAACASRLTRSTDARSRVTLHTPQHAIAIALMRRTIALSRGSSPLPDPTVPGA
jgi:hypothetical protein